ncbi:helix-turn-helix domain-containing protein [Amycolatopsis eburnea]|uniref:XRE family transcriptional regulator n=1 Tax=Amycolatopsis eburnea TaxID=2267691 RepID=A0A427TGD6_9PSEU|nr:helix-turn-helix transcriptional regulator [Amycolatopsis eburnea]RSD22165.1 XRE family transcriptional regulator [Amycolatopsis eburnea]
MKWNLRLVAAKRGIWKAGELRELLAAEGMEISAGKMSKLWSGDPASVKLAELDVLCRVLDCAVGELLVPAVPRHSEFTKNEIRSRKM